MNNSHEWTAKADEDLKIPVEYLEGIQYEVLILSAKKLMTFQCRSYRLDGPATIFTGVIIDSSEKNARGKVTLQRVSYHDTVILANTGFMAIPIPSPAPDQSAKEEQDVQERAAVPPCTEKPT